MSKIVKNNLLLLIGITLFATAINLVPASNGLGVLLMCATIVGMAIGNLILLIVGLFTKSPDTKYYLLSAFLILLIGIPACIGSFFLGSSLTRL